MSDKVMSRRKFLVSAGTVAGAAAVAGFGLAKSPSPAQAAGVDLPWPYPTNPAEQLDPKAAARLSYQVYYESGCAEGTFRSIVNLLAPKYPETWGTLPKNLFWYGRGGAMEMGTLCGAINGSIAIIAACLGKGKVGDADTITHALTEYYMNTPMPTDAAGHDYAAGWIPSGPNVKNPLPNAPSSIANSPLCHSALAQWTLMTGKANGSVDQKDRCAKICYDMTHKTVTVLNQYFSSAVIPAEEVDPIVAACMTCHKPNAKGTMPCNSCHEQSLGGASGH